MTFYPSGQIRSAASCGAEIYDTGQRRKKSFRRFFSGAMIKFLNKLFNGFCLNEQFEFPLLWKVNTEQWKEVKIYPKQRGKIQTRAWVCSCKWCGWYMELQKSLINETLVNLVNIMKLIVQQYVKISQKTKIWKILRFCWKRILGSIRLCWSRNKWHLQQPLQLRRRQKENSPVEIENSQNRKKEITKRKLKMIGEEEKQCIWNGKENIK